jgi:muramidase (phage lysozyme)
MTGLLAQRTNFPNTKYGYELGGAGVKEYPDGKYRIDCSHLLYRMMLSAGYDVEYENTSALKKSKYYVQVGPEDVRAGDVVLWLNAVSNDRKVSDLDHVGVVESYDPAKDAGQFFGSQSSTGPASTKFGIKKHSYFWPSATIFLRPKPEYRTTNGSTNSGEKVQEKRSEISSSASVAEIKFSYPIYQSSGQAYPDADRVFRALAAEPSGTYLIGKGNFFHGGIHITDKVAPHCKDKDMVRCIADGTVVAYRLNGSYLESTHKSDKLRYSSSFCLVRHDYASPRGKSGRRNTLTFYSLYMHLAAFSDYTATVAPRIYEITESRLRARSKPELGSDYLGYVNVGAQIEVSEILEVVNTGTTYVFAKGVLRSGQVKSGTGKVEAKAGDTIWVAIEKKGTPPDHYAVPVKTSVPALPGYWGGQPELDKINICNISIKAGDPVGRLGLYEIVANGQGGVISKSQVHLEVFTFDPKIDAFLKNAAGVKQGKQRCHIKKGTALWTQVGTEFKSSNATLPCDLNLSPNTKTTKDQSGKEWLAIEYTGPDQCLRGHVPADAAETICQHDWEKMGFQTIKAPANFDGYLPPILPPPFFQELYQKVTGNPAPIDRDSIRKTLTDEQYRDAASKIVVKNISDWKHSSTHNVWAILDRIMKKSPEMVAHERERVDKCIWWDEVAAKLSGFDKTGEAWHFHPLGFCANLKTAICVEEARLRAFMRMIRVGEGTVGKKGYETLFGGKSFVESYGRDFGDHPQIKITSGELTSSAAGAYQVMGYTWTDPKMVRLRKEYGITDFSPLSQDIFCFLLLKYKVKSGAAYNLILSGEIEKAVEICSWEWASLPPGRYGQPSKTMPKVKEIFDSYFAEEVAGESDLVMTYGFI